MRSLAAIRRDAQVGIDLSPLERAINKFVQTSGPAIAAAFIFAAYDGLTRGLGLRDVLAAGLAAAGPIFYASLRKYWTALQDTPGSTPVVEPPSPAAPDDSAAVGTYPVDAPNDGGIDTTGYPATATNTFVPPYTPLAAETPASAESDAAEVSA